MRARLAAGVAALVLLLGHRSSGQELSPALRVPFDAGVQALKAGRLDEAEAAFQRVLREGGRTAFVHNNLGIVLQRRDQHDKAVVQFREAIRLDPSYAAPRILLGASLLALGRAAEATTVLEGAVRLVPREPLARQQLARAYERAGNLLAVVEQYRKLRELAPDDPETAYQLGRAYLALSAWSLDHLREVNPGSARLHQALGHNYRVQGKPEMAEQAFRRAAEADPTLPEVHLALAQLYVEQKRWAEARTEIERERALVPESAGARALQQRLEAEENVR
jgi:tetratricopeptide (TPR) repeat protein